METTAEQIKKLEQELAPLETRNVRRKKKLRRKRKRNLNQMLRNLKNILMSLTESIMIHFILLANTRALIILRMYL